MCAKISTFVYCHRQRNWAVHANALMNLSRCDTKIQILRCVIASVSIPINVDWNATRVDVSSMHKIDRDVCAQSILKVTSANDIDVLAIVRIVAFAT